MYTGNSITKGALQMVRRLICFLLVLGWVIALGVPALAWAETGSIRVTLHNGDTVVPNGAVSLYYAGVPMAFDYRLTEDFGGGIVREQDALSPALALWLAEMAHEVTGVQRLLDADGSAEFSDLPEGLYLIVQTERSSGYHLMEPMMIQLPCQSQWQIQAYPKTEEIIYPVEIPPTGQSPAPFLGSAGMIVSGAGLLVCARRRRRA